MADARTCWLLCVSACNFDPLSRGYRRPKLTPCMLTDALLALIRSERWGNADSGDDRPDWREHYIKGKTIREIARDLKVSRNMVRKVLRSGETSVRVRA